ncbi:MAG: hypothetical protein LBF15_03385 [Candidatus Peribacteria bacterium]|jgi:predicted MPP superfamily phosphohydrolase|nr:hypothetical protein [Candidatus Peribacteria bacterium]
MGNTPITLLDNEFVIVDGVQIVGLNSVAVLNTREKLNEVLLDLEKSGFDREKPSILLLHEPHYINEFIDF